MPTRLDQHFVLIVETLLGAYPDAELIDTTRESALGRGGPVMRSAALFRSGLTVAGSPDVDAVYLQKEDGFWIKWRSSMPSATMDAVSPRVRALIDALSQQRQATWRAGGWSRWAEQGIRLNPPRQTDVNLNRALSVPPSRQLAIQKPSRVVGGASRHTINWNWTSGGAI